MNFLKYSNETQSNIIPQDEFESLIQEVFGVISSNLCKSLGPLGSSATILDGMLTEATKDGYSILRKYRFHNRYKKMIYNLILAPCTKMNNTVGDGTTTAIALTNSIFKRYTLNKNKLQSLYRLPRQFTQAWDNVIETITERIKNKSSIIDPEDYDTIYNIAYVTSNGNCDVSKNIADVYKESKSPNIKRKDSPTNKSYISAINGFDFPSHLISDAYVKNEDLSVTEKDTYVMIFDYKVETELFTKLIVPINEVLKAMGHKFIILAPSYDAYLIETMIRQYVEMEFRKNGNINLILSQFEMSKLSKNQMTDLATIVKCKVINQDLSANFINEIDNGEHSIDIIVNEILNNKEYSFTHTIGFVDSVMLTCNNGSIFQVNNIVDDEIYNETLRRARKELNDITQQTSAERQSYSSKIYDARARVQQLEMNNYIYYVGADSALQKQILEDSIDDVIKCVRSAIKYGIVPGCQLNIINICKEMIDEYNHELKDNISNVYNNDIRLQAEISALILDACIDVYSMILNGPDGTGILKTIPRWQYTAEDGIEELNKELNTKINEIIKNSVDKNTVFDLETLDYNQNIITSAETDELVLIVASDLIKILISGNQCVFLDSDINESHQETKEFYV